MKPEECPSWNAPGDPDRPHIDPARLGLPVTESNVERLRSARAIDDFLECLNEDVRLRMAMNHLELVDRNQQLAEARRRPKSNPLADMLGALADVARARGGKLWPTVRDALLESLEHGTPLLGDFEVKEITGAGFGDTHRKDELAGYAITFILPDGGEQSISAHMVYKYVMA